MPRSIVFLAIAVALIAVFLWPTKSSIVINNQKISVFIADSPREWERGLSGRKSLKSDEGMLFVFPEPTTPAFWMKDMRFAIDIIWLDENKKIVDIERNISPDTYPKKFSPPVPVRYVLETNPGVLISNDVF
jgi:uncharacterized protein